jgi:hypothetical protein
MGMPMPNTMLGSLPERIWDFFSGRNERKHNERLQREFAQNAISWRVADANRAGIHPLYALGAPTLSPSVSVGGGVSSAADMGQDISRALSAGMPREGQLSSFEQAIQDLQLKKYGLENELLAAQIRRINTEVLSKPALPLTMPGGAQFSTGNQSSAQTVQDRYGDIVENVYGLGSLGYDAILNLRQIGDNFRSNNASRYGRDGLLRNPRNVDPRKRWLQQNRR